MRNELARQPALPSTARSTRRCPPAAIVPAADHALVLGPRTTYGGAQAAGRCGPGRGSLAFPALQLRLVAGSPVSPAGGLAHMSALEDPTPWPVSEQLFVPRW